MTFPIPTLYAVTFGDEPADTASRRLRNPQRLIRPAPNPIDNVRIPARAGRIAVPNMPDQSAPFELIWELDGRTDRTGEPFADPREGMLHCVEEFIADIYKAELDDGAVPVTMSAGVGGWGYQGRIQFADCDFANGQDGGFLWQAEARLVCVLPDGELERTSSS